MGRSIHASGGSHPTPTEPGRQRLLVLVIDDDAGVQRALRRALREHQVEIAKNGDEGLRILTSNREFDVVFCDLMMDDISGMELYERTKASAPELAERFVFITGGAFTPPAQRFMAKVENHVLLKPFDIDDIHKQLPGRTKA